MYFKITELTALAFFIDLQLHNEKGSSPSNIGILFWLHPIASYPKLGGPVPRAPLVGGWYFS